MTEQKWRSPRGHPIASDVTDKLPPKGEVMQGDVQAALLDCLKDAVFLWDAEKSLINKDDINKWREVIARAEQKDQNHE